MTTRTGTPSLTRTEALDRLHAYLAPGATVYCICRHVSASGMSRRLSFITFHDNRPVILTTYIAAALGYKLKDDGNWSIRVDGCGMDMGFDVVSSLSRAMFPDSDRPDHQLTSEWL